MSLLVRAERLESRRLFATVPAGFIDQAVGGSISSGSAMEFAPDGRLFVVTQTGSVRVIDQSGNLLATPAATLTVDSFFERGLLGIAFDPSFNASQPGNDYVYLYYTLPSAQGGPINQISRFTVTGNTIDVASRAEIWRFNTLSAGNHNGGAIHFGPDGMLYAAHGENAVSSNAQSISNQLGKIMRLNVAAYDPANPAAVIPSNNPTSFPGIAGTTSGNNRAIWALGLRNPYTFAFHPTNGRLFINDVGQSTWEEINDGIAGRNYGWPTTEGNFTQSSFPNFTQPLYAYSHTNPSPPGGFAISGGSFYSTSASSQFPQQYQQKYFFGDYVNDWISYVDPANLPTSANSGTAFATGTTGIVDIKIGPDGSLYYLQRDSAPGVRRIRPDPTQAPSIIDQPDNANVFNGDAAVFEVVAGGAGTLSYQWTRNGVDIVSANGPTYVLANAQAGDSGAVFRCRVTNAIGTALSNPATLGVTVDAPPEPSISLPTAGTKYTAGDTINFAGSATDPEEGALPASNLEWEVVFHHDTHTHPFMAPTSGIAAGQFTIPQTGETAADVFYRVYLRATDSLGRRAETFVDVTPRTASLQLASNVPGLALNLDGQPKVTPYNFTGVAGIIRNLEAPLSQVFAGQTYEFQSWSDGGAALHDITTPLIATTYTATYLDVTDPVADAIAFNYSLPAPAAPHSIAIDFSENVGPSLATTDFTMTNLTTSATIPAAAVALSYGAVNRATLTFPGLSGGQLPNGNYRMTIGAGAISDSFGNTNPRPFAAEFFVLAGDANHSRSVDLDDFTTLAASFGLVGRVFSQGDFNYDAAVNLDDFTILASAFGTSLPPARATVGASAAGDRRIFGGTALISAVDSLFDAGDEVLPA